MPPVPRGPTLSIIVPIEDVTLPPELEQFAAEAVAAGRYRDTAEVVRAGVDLLEHFAKLPGGRHARLEVVEDERDKRDKRDKRKAIVAIATDGKCCPVTALSEGTRDQLYLALRLAAFEDYPDRATPLPFIADDLLVQFDDARARAAIAVLADLAARTQVILFTHHARVAAMVASDIGHVQRLPPVSADHTMSAPSEAAAGA